MNIKRLGYWLARPVLLHWLLPYLMLLIVIGTVAQKSIGLYESQRLFFSSFVFWAGLLPLPGGRMVTALLLTSLLAKLIIASPWRKATAGIFITHLGVLLLLLGGLVTSLSSLEGYAALGKGESANGFSDYHKRELTISKNGKALLKIALPDLASGKMISDPALPFTLSITKLCHNCTMAARGGDIKNMHAIAQKVTLTAIADELDQERNLAGVEFTLNGAGANNGGYIAFEPMDKQPAFTLGKDNYRIALGREHYPLPFTLQLVEAKKELHPGTDTPSSYRSTVMLTDGEVKQRAVITMNHPLRYKGYTVYQASFNGEEQGDMRVSFAIVQNSGRVFPYVASITLCIGLLIHLAFRLPILIRKRDAD